MAKRLQHRIGEIERRLSEIKLSLPPRLRSDARHHAIAVAAIVLSGQPRIDEPLRDAWARTLQHHGISVKNPWSWGDQVVAARQLSQIVMDGGADESAQFTQIFKTAPVWLLQFTGTAMDARLLKFQLPDISTDLSWGDAGCEDARRWPSLPLGSMADGKPIPSLDPRCVWIVLSCPTTIREFPDHIDLFEEEKTITDPFIKDLAFSLDLDGVPEEELSRYEKRRLRRLSKQISGL
jgi:hypothetical protein